MNKPNTTRQTILTGVLMAVAIPAGLALGAVTGWLLAPSDQTLPHQLDRIELQLDWLQNQHAGQASQRLLTTTLADNWNTLLQSDNNDSELPKLAQKTMSLAQAPAIYQAMQPDSPAQAQAALQALAEQAR